MDTINWLHLRGLALLALLGLFVMYASLLVSWQSWQGRRRMTEQDPPLFAKPTMTEGGDCSDAKPQLWHDARADADPKRRAA